VRHDALYPCPAHSHRAHDPTIDPSLVNVPTKPDLGDFQRLQREARMSGVSATDTTRTIQMVPIGQIRPAPDNPRTVDGGNLGDLTELTASIQAHGVLQPLVVRPEQDGTYLCVLGHRRLAAADAAGLTEVPAEPRRLSDVDRMEIMLIENLHREDLSPLQEARGYRQALDNNSQLTQRQLAKRVGKSQGHISKHLKLLTLTPKAQAAVQAGQVSVTDAHEYLVQLKGMPERMDAALERPHNIQWAVGQQLREHEQAVNRAQAEQRLQQAGVTIIPGPEHGAWRNFHAKPLTGQPYYGYGSDEIKVDPQAHAAEACHAAVLKDDGTVILVCTDPKRHRKGGDSQVKTGLTEDQKVERRAKIARNKAARAARDTRTEFMIQQLKRRIPLSDLLRELALQWAHHADGRILEIACALLQQATGEKLVQDEHRGWVDYRAPLLAYAARDDDALLRLAQALMFAAPEQQQHVDYPQFSGSDLAVHIAFLERRGYQVSDVERTELARYRSDQRSQSDDDEHRSAAGEDLGDDPVA